MGSSGNGPPPKADSSTPSADPYNSDPCGLHKCAAACAALIENCDPIIPSCFPFRRQNECLKGCAAQKACADKREQESRERLRNNPGKSKPK
jgi:hypothetical protein